MTRSSSPSDDCMITGCMEWSERLPELSVTPGPWMRDGISVTTNAPAGEPRKTICITHPDMLISGYKSHERMKANARLIAAAPDLYAACVWAEAALAPFSKEPAERSGIALLRDALANARGETP